MEPHSSLAASYPVLGATFAFAAAVQPGPLQIFLISRTLTYGWRRTLPAVFAPVFSDVPIVCMTLLVLARLPPMLVRALQGTGGLFLMYLAFGAFKAYRGYRHEIERESVPARRTVLSATLVNLLNPNPYLAWVMVLGPLLLKAWDKAPAEAIAFVGAFYGTMVTTTAVILSLFAGARGFGPRVVRVLVGISAAALFLFGLYEVWAGLATPVRTEPVTESRMCDYLELLK
jgi:threonine/homoserine/homoserine lactone efflux protein